MSDTMKVHDLKSWTEHFDFLWDGSKTFEPRRNDRDYRAGDLLVMREHIPGTQEFTGRVAVAKVTHIMVDAKPYTADGYCIMSIKIIDRYEP